MNTTSALIAAVTLPTLLLPSLSWAAGEVGFIERFALSADRDSVLSELVPGSEDYYYFYALHYQNTRNEAKLAEILDQWKRRSPNENQRRREIENREALLDYATDPQGTIKYLRERLGPQFNHVAEQRDKKPDLPVALDPKRVARDVFVKDALAHDGNLGSLSIEEQEELIKAKVPLTEEREQQRRSILNRLTRPDVPGLVEVIIADLKHRVSGGFGEFPIHRALLPEQLDALVKAIPSLATNEAFVYTRLRKLAPGADADVQYDAVEREAWLNRVWDYVKALPPAFNTLKANVLFRRLDHDRKLGKYDRERFAEYLKLPRQGVYVNPKWIQQRRNDENLINLSQDFADPLLTSRPIGNDEALVREYFLALFAQQYAQTPPADVESALAPWVEQLRESWLKPVFAEAMIINGIGNAERWAPLLTPTAFQKLRDRVDIEFPTTNTQFTQPGDEVQIDVFLKNTPKLIVKVYELNTLNFFLTQKRQLNTDLNLDGLVANSEQTHTVEGGPFKRGRQTFKFPELRGKRGAWVVEFIGGGA